MKPSVSASLPMFAVLALWTPLCAHATLDAFAGVVGGSGNGSIAGGCTTFGPPSDLAFFGGAAAGLQVLGGNAACGYSGGWSTHSSTGSKAPVLNSAALPPTVLGNLGYAESFSGTAAARASYGSLSASSHGQYSGLPISYTAGTTVAASVGAATFSDTMTATVSTSYTDLSSAGFVRYVFSIDGSISTPGPHLAFFGGEALTDLPIQNDAGPIYDELFAHSLTDDTGTVTGEGATTGWTTGTGTVSGGTTFETRSFAIDLFSSWDFKAGLITNAYGNADNDFYSTAKVVGIELYDFSGTRITDFSLSSASGTDYVGGTAGAVPEPSSIALLVVGLAAGAGMQMRRTRLLARG